LLVTVYSLKFKVYILADAVVVVSPRFSNIKSIHLQRQIVEMGLSIRLA